MTRLTDYLNARPHLCALICLAIAAVTAIGLYRLELWAEGRL